MKKFLLILVLSIKAVSANAQFVLGSFASSMGGTGVDVGTHIATDASGNIYTVGYFESTGDFDPGSAVVTLTSAGAEDVYITKQSSSGTLLWARSIGGVNTDIGAGIGVDNAGNVYVSGYYGGIVDLDPGPASYTFFAGSIEVFIVKLDASGNFVWGQSMGSGGNDKAMAMCVDGSGNVYTAGYFEGTMDFDPGAGTYNITPFGSLGDIFVCKLTTAGNFAWASNLGGVDVENPHAITVDGFANVYLTGYFENVCDFDPGAGTYTLDAGASGKDAFVCKLDGNGGFVWADQFGGAGDQNGTGIILNGGNVYVAGEFQNTVDFDPGVATFNLSSTGSFYSSYAVKLTQGGNFVWANAISGNDDVLGGTIRVDNFGFVYWSGFNKGTADLDPGSGTNNSTSITGFDTFLSVLGVSGSYVAADAFPYEWNSFLVKLGTSNLVAVGKYSLTRDFDPGPVVYNMTSGGMTDACVVEIALSLSALEANSGGILQSLLYPNPSDGKFFVDLKEPSTITITNALGQIVACKKFDRGVHSIGLTESGIYFAHLTNDQGDKEVRKIVVRN
jgi:hypothetical protein